MEIQGKIIRIIDKYTVVVNLGRIHGITSDSIFNIIGLPEDIIDPFSGENLGSVSVVKSKVKSQQVYDKFTIASAKWVQRTLKFGRSMAVALSDCFESHEVDQGELFVEDRDVRPWKAVTETPVKVGDVVSVTVAENIQKSVESDKQDDQVEGVQDEASA